MSISDSPGAGLLHPHLYLNIHPLECSMAISTFVRPGSKMPDGTKPVGWLLAGRQEGKNNLVSWQRPRTLERSHDSPTFCVPPEREKLGPAATRWLVTQESC